MDNITTSKSGKRPGLLVIQEWWGVNDHIKDVARRLQNEGFITVPVDIVTFPLQVPFVFCIWKFYDVQICDAREHDSPALNGLIARCSEPASGTSLEIPAPSTLPLAGRWRHTPHETE